MRLLQKSQKIIEYEETLGINELLPGEDFKILKKTKRYYEIKLFNPSTKRSRQLLFCKFKRCGKKFSRKCGLKDHILIHEDIKPYKCDLCPKHFTQQGNKEIHQRSCAKRRKLFEETVK
jgi:hypothetical protein